MADQFQKKPNGTMIAGIRSSQNGDQRIFRPNGTRLGTYWPGSNRSYLPNGTMIGVGNLLATLVH